MKICFLFNHDQIHQIGHALPVAIAMVRDHPGHEIVIATTNERLTDEVHHLAAGAGVRLRIVELALRRSSSRIASRHLNAIGPVAKFAIYRDNLEFFRAFDALVVTEKTSLVLRERYGLDNLKIIHTRHGAGDRAIGFCAKSAGFDHVLVSGAKIRDRLTREAGIPADRMSLVGYPKFDGMPTDRPTFGFADPSKPTVLYNPHPSPHLSSWYRQGREVLEHFLRDDRYNLIFAPHVMLFHRRFVLTIDKLRMARPGSIGRRFREAPNILIDLGSRASTDMTYTAAADIYLGDVSSQVYEFLHDPRPCLFLDAHGVDWRTDANYAHWQAGEVITDAAKLGPALDRAVTGHHRFRPIQRELFAASFDLTAEPSADRAARAIANVLAPTAPVPLFGHRRVGPLVVTAAA